MPIFVGMLLQRDVIEIWIIINIVLWISYYLDKPSLKDFGNITNKSLQYYMLICASLAYIANFINVLMLRDMSPDLSLKLAIISYYFLQLFFITAVRSNNNKRNVRLLLGLACIPMLYFVIASVRRGKTMEIILSVFVFLHVFINDFLLFGHMF